VADTVASLLARHRSEPKSIKQTIQQTYARIREADDPAIFIALRSEAEMLAEADGLIAGMSPDLPLFGIPVAVKDNIDAAGFPTTAACPAFSYVPDQDATAVQRLRQAGALVIGKTNLDQFATGLVGVRSPYGVPRNPLRPDLVPGGSSSGSAVAVSRGIVPIALGTDTAGSGRVPAGLNNIVGLKPSLGLVSTSGVVPACRSLDCVSIFALTVQDAFTTLSAIAGPDSRDGYSRTLPLGTLGGALPHARVAIPRVQDRLFFGDTRAEASFSAAIELAQRLGWTVAEVDLSPCLQTARLLYEGAWVAERTAAVGEFIARHPTEIHPVTKKIIEPGSKLSAVDAFRGMYRVAEHARAARAMLAGFDALLVPTAPANYTLADLETDPIAPNSRLGTYTNFVNLMDLCGLAVPVSLASDGLPHGVTFLAPAGCDARLATLGAAMHAATGLSLGAVGTGTPPRLPEAAIADGEIALAVVGAHLSGMPLNHELRDLGARFIRAATTSRDYRLFALSGTSPPKPGLLRIESGQGASIEIEIWALSKAAFGQFVANIPPPLSIGTVRTSDAQFVKGFLVEAEGVKGARDVSSSGGWRAAVAALSQTGR